MRTPNVAKMDGNQQLALYICSAVCAEKAKKEKNSLGEILDGKVWATQTTAYRGNWR